MESNNLSLVKKWKKAMTKEEKSSPVDKPHDKLTRRLLSSLQTMDQLGYKDEVADLLYYLYNEGNLNDSSQFWSFLHRKFSKNVEEKIMTLGQKAVQQAVQQALKQGAEQNSKEMVLRMLEKKLDVALIAELTHLSVVEIKQLAKELN